MELVLKECNGYATEDIPDKDKPGEVALQARRSR